MFDKVLNIDGQREDAEEFIRDIIENWTHLTSYVNLSNQVDYLQFEVRCLQSSVKKLSDITSQDIFLKLKHIEKENKAIRDRLNFLFNYLDIKYDDDAAKLKEIRLKDSSIQISNMLKNKTN